LQIAKEGEDGECGNEGIEKLTLWASDSFSCLMVSITWKTYEKHPKI
jgi:hypothetical protein